MLFVYAFKIIQFLINDQRFWSNVDKRILSMLKDEVTIRDFLFLNIFRLGRLFSSIGGTYLPIIVRTVIIHFVIESFRGIALFYHSHNFMV